MAYTQWHSSWDIDLLINENILSQAYDVLKKLGFRYHESKKKDSTKYHAFGHHLPRMEMIKNTKLEFTGV